MNKNTLTRWEVQKEKCIKVALKRPSPSREIIFANVFSGLLKQIQFSSYGGRKSSKVLICKCSLKNRYYWESKEQ